ncbi:MAG: thioredoxin-like domain-containing protein [Bacteroidota bacterium]
MKQTLFIIVLLLLVSCSQKKNTVISGKLEGGAGSMLYLEQLNVNQTRPVDSVKVKKDDSFRMKIEVTDPELYVLKNNTGKIISLLPMPGETVAVTTTSGNFGKPYQVSGSPESEKILLLVNRLNRTRTLLDSIGQVLLSLPDQDNDESLALKKAYIEARNDQKRFTIRFLLENISSPSSVFALYQKFSRDEYVLNDNHDLQYLIIVSDSLSSHYPNSTLTLSLAEDVRRQKDAYNQMVKLGDLVGKANMSGSLDLAIPDTEGDTVRLHKLIGKVVLVSFWASWDKNSTDANLTLKNTWKKYSRKGFEVYSVSLDNSREQWLNRVRFEQYPWINVCELSYPDSYAKMIYNVQQLPTSFLIDREGNIIARNLYGKELEKWLDNIL